SLSPPAWRWLAPNHAGSRWYHGRGTARIVAYALSGCCDAHPPQETRYGAEVVQTEDPGDGTLYDRGRPRRRARGACRAADGGAPRLGQPLPPDGLVDRARRGSARCGLWALPRRGGLRSAQTAGAQVVRG